MSIQQPNEPMLPGPWWRLASSVTMIVLLSFIILALVHGFWGFGFATLITILLLLKVGLAAPLGLMSERMQSQLRQFPFIRHDGNEYTVWSGGQLLAVLCLAILVAHFYEANLKPILFQ